MVEQAIHSRRWWILGLLFLITVINFIDRQTLSVLAPVICSAFHLTSVAYGRIVAALQFGMMSGEFPMGYLMDRWGTRLGIAFAVTWWPSATAAQVFARTGTQFGLIRYWMGTGECGNFSGGVKTATRLFAPAERTLAIGIFNAGSMVGATVAPPLIVYLLHHYGFRSAFLIPAALGLVWLVAWWFVYQRAAPLRSEVCEPRVSLGELLSDSALWAVMTCRFFVGPVIQFYWYWIPMYLYAVRHMSLTRVGFLSWIPFLLGDAGNVLGGWAAGILLRHGVSVRRTRQWLMYGSSTLCFASFLVPFARGSVVALAMIGIAVAAHNFLSADMYGPITDLFPDSKVGRATGLTVVASGLLFPLLTGILVDQFSYSPVFGLIALMPLVGTIALFILGREYRMMGTSRRESATQLQMEGIG